MARKLLLAVLLALVPAAPAAAQGTRTLLVPGVSYSREVEFTPRGPVVVHVVTAPRPGGLYGVQPVLSNNAIVGRERLTSIERGVSGGATAVGITGDLFAANGQPSGILMRGGALDSPPLVTRSSVGIGSDGTLRVERIAYVGIWRGTGQRRPLNLNRPPGANGVSLFTPAWGPSTPPLPSATTAVLPSLPPTAPNTDLTATVAQLGTTSGAVAIPPGGAVVVARGAGAARLAAEAPVGTQLELRLTLTPSWDGVPQAIGGGPLIVRAGKPVFRANEAFGPELLAPRAARGAVGQLRDGRIVLVAVDGGQLGYSVGMTNFELALTLVRLGAVTGSALAGGDSAALAFDGALLDRPSAGVEPAVADALLVLYYGVYAPPPTEAVLSPNGDGLGERETVSYKVVRPSTVTAALSGPAGASVPVYSGDRPPGTYRFTWDGAGAAEGQWRFSVAAVDDLGRRSSADRSFSLNETLGFLQAPPAVAAQLRASFRLAHPARVTATVERRTGAVVRTLLRRSLAPGTVPLTWGGRDDRGIRAGSGRYLLRVVAENELGSVQLTRQFGLGRAS